MKQAPAHAAVIYARKKGWIDIPQGLQLMRDRNVPVAWKIQSLGLGFVLMLALQAFEFPLETLVDALTGFLATPLMLAFDGLEFLALPILFGAAILARRANRLPA